MPVKTKIAIIGVGLLGGSLALALKKHKNLSLVGWNHRPSSRKKAARLLPVASSFEKAVKGAGVIVLCSHSSSIGPALRQLARLIQADTLIMDVSSVKGAVVEEARGIPGIQNHFVPCHPMAGKEKSGSLYADAGLYRGKVVFITPLPGNHRLLIQRAARFWKKVGALPLVTDVKSHDRGVALTSHLPHLLASVLMNLFGQSRLKSPVFQKAVGSGFRDFTRIAAGNPAMWRDIVKMNSANIKSFLTQYRQQLAQLQRNFGKGKDRYWLSFFEHASELREKLQ